MNMTNETKTTPRVVIYACSGCSDAGELADRTARALAQQELGEMSCLAGIGGRVKPLLNKAAQADLIVAVDGCPLNCARHTLELAGFKDVHQLELHRLGLRKGDCPPDDKNVARAVQAGAELIHSLKQSPNINKAEAETSSVKLEVT
jgi:uncharacterized metal-binding protein